MQTNYLSDIKFNLIRIKSRIIIWACITFTMTILNVAMLQIPSVNSNSFFPTFILLALYTFLMITDILKYRKLKQQEANFKLQFGGVNDKINTFLQNDVCIKLIQKNDISIKDKYGNQMIIFKTNSQWLIEVSYTDKSYPVYHSLRFEKYPPKTNWLSKGINKEPKWHHVIQALIKGEDNP